MGDIPLSSQLKRYLRNADIDLDDSSDVPQEKVLQLITAVEKSYYEKKKEVSILENALEISSMEIQEYIHDLEEKTILLTNAAKMSAIGEMASGIAHEINSPLQSIALQTYKIKKIDISANRSALGKVVDKIDHAVNGIVDIIESLGKMSRDSSADPYYPVKLKEIVKNVSGITRERYLVKSINLSINYHNNCEDVFLVCQQTQIGQILINLLNNAYDAVKYENEKWITLDVYDSDNNIVFAVSDSGKGVPQELVNRVFDPLFTTKDIGEGTGLGLSISMKIARHHNGTLCIDSNYKCTKFLLTIPKDNEM
ncbi:MAG: HAMP domain-containing sensor histidine kinase [Pseudomonadota bacterium]